MKNQIFIFVIALLMCIAYVDLVDSFKYFDKITSKIIKTNVNHGTSTNKLQNKIFKTQK
jgi:hypothetical protein